MLQAIRNYFAPDARAKRAIEAERRALKAEQRSNTATRAYLDMRDLAIARRQKELKYLEAPTCRRAEDFGQAVKVITGSASLSCTGRMCMVEDGQTMREQFEASCDGVMA